MGKWNLQPTLRWVSVNELLLRGNIKVSPGKKGDMRRESNQSSLTGFWGNAGQGDQMSRGGW